MLSHPFTIAWLLWGLLFAVIEAAGVRRRAPGTHASPVEDGDTLSDHVWWLERRKIGPVPAGWVAFTVGWVILTAHFFLRWP